jgi:hypothetical protein
VNVSKSSDPERLNNISVGSSTRGLESSSEVALESVGRSFLGWVSFIGGGGFFFSVCVVCCHPSMLRNIHL